MAATKGTVAATTHDTSRSGSHFSSATSDESAAPLREKGEISPTVV